MRTRSRRMVGSGLEVRYIELRSCATLQAIVDHAMLGGVSVSDGGIFMDIGRGIMTYTLDDLLQRFPHAT